MAISSYDIAVIGGGMVGSAIAYGLARHGVNVVLLDQGDIAFRAARGNFGLIWVQGKGVDEPHYAAWTRQSANAWPQFAAQLKQETGVDVAYERRGGFEFCLSDQQFDGLERELGRLRDHSAGKFEFEMLDRPALNEYFFCIGKGVTGASYSPHDGCANPLYLLRALHTGFLKYGGVYSPNVNVDAIQSVANGFTLKCGIVKVNAEQVNAERIIIAAGVRTPDLAQQIGLKVTVNPIRGQILVTEKVVPFLKHPTLQIRQTAEGGCLLGDSHEKAGFDERTRARVIGTIANRAVQIFPFLSQVKVIRAWGSLRTMTADGMPVYDVSNEFPGAYVAVTHSGVTLAAAHADRLAGWLADDRIAEQASDFSSQRFDVQVH